MKKRNLIYDLLRIFAGLCVFAVHTRAYLGIEGKIGDLMSRGDSGLFVFYVMTGFLVFASLDRVSEEGYPVKWLGRKLVRLLPIYYAVMLAYLILHQFIWETAPELPNLGLLRSFLCLNQIAQVRIDFWSKVGATRSFSVFVWFTILAPVLKKLISNLKRAGIFFVGTYVLSRLILHFDEELGINAVTFLYYFAIGILGYYFVREGKKNLALLCGSILIAIMTYLQTSGGLLYAIAIGMILVGADGLNIAYGKFLAPVKVLSDLTFPLWLAHAFVLEVSRNAGIPVNAAIYLAMVAAVTAVLYLCIELPAVSLWQRREKANDN